MLASLSLSLSSISTVQLFPIHFHCPNPFLIVFRVQCSPFSISPCYIAFAMNEWPLTITLTLFLSSLLSWRTYFTYHYHYIALLIGYRVVCDDDNDMIWYGYSVVSELSHHPKNSAKKETLEITFFARVIFHSTCTQDCCGSTKEQFTSSSSKRIIHFFFSPFSHRLRRYSFHTGIFW